MPEENQIRCPNCGQSYAVQPAQWAQYNGRSINCTRCGQSFTVTAPPQVMAQQEAGFPSTAGALPSQPGMNPVSVGTPSLPYGTYQNQGFPITPTEKNGLALTSLILGFVGFCVPVL